MRKSTDTPREREETWDFHMRSPISFVRKLDALRRREKDFPSRAEMMRRLVERAK